MHKWVPFIMRSSSQIIFGGTILGGETSSYPQPQSSSK